MSGHHPAGKPYHGQVDAFGVYCEATGRSYLVPLAVIPEHRVLVCLRVSPSRNGQRIGIHMANDSLLGLAQARAGTRKSQVLSHIHECVDPSGGAGSRTTRK